MVIKHATYVDNQEEIQYPIEFILSKFPDLIIYSSDEKNYNYLKSKGIESKIIDHKINEPIDISIAQNKCIEDIFLDNSVDFIIWNQADILITELGKQVINEFCIEENLNKSKALGLLHIKLFHLCGYSYFGVNAIGRNSYYKYTGDGAYIGEGINDYTKDKYIAETIDIGYLTINQCKRHLSTHKNTWKHNDNIHLLNDNDFVKQFIKKHNYEGLINENSKFYYLIKEMSLENEYQKIINILNN